MLPTIVARTGDAAAMDLIATPLPVLPLIRLPVSVMFMATVLPVPSTRMPLPLLVISHLRKDGIDSNGPSRLDRGDAFSACLGFMRVLVM